MLGAIFQDLGDATLPLPDQVRHIISLRARKANIDRVSGRGGELSVWCVTWIFGYPILVPCTLCPVSGIG